MKNHSLTDAYSRPAQQDKPVLLPDDLTTTYRDVLQFALRYKARVARHSRYPGNQQLSAVVKNALLQLVGAGQAGNMPPSKLKKMVVASSASRLSHRNWQHDPAAEAGAGLLAGVCVNRQAG